jgi:predicted transcriptional regulator
MTYGIDSLHKILKDEKRRKIILLLSETENLSYMDLMNSLEIKSTGKLNYHLKILGDLLSKTEDGKYTLTEKGKTALQLLKNFPEENRQQLGLKPKWWRRFWIENLVFTVIVITDRKSTRLNSSH